MGVMKLKSEKEKKHIFWKPSPLDKIIKVNLILRCL